jgi:dTDP-4-dehydrorhamnose reductase
MPLVIGFDFIKTNKELGFYPKSFKEHLLKFKEKLA